MDERSRRPEGIGDPFARVYGKRRLHLAGDFAYQQSAAGQKGGIAFGDTL